MKSIFAALTVIMCIQLVGGFVVRAFGFSKRSGINLQLWKGNSYNNVRKNREILTSLSSHWSSEVFERIKSGYRLPQSTLESIPNALTIGRVMVVPALMASMSWNKRGLTYLLFVLASVTDYLDGYLARKFNVQSSFGSFLDPVADKLLMATSLVLLSVQFPSIWYILPVAIIMCREIAVSALREWMAERGERDVVKVGMVGKIKTVLQMVSVAILLLVNPRSRYIGFCMFDKTYILTQQGVFLSALSMLYISTALTVYSGWQYFKAAWPVLTKS